MKFLGTCIEPKPLKKALLGAETGYLPCAYPEGVPEPGAPEPGAPEPGAPEAEPEPGE